MKNLLEKVTPDVREKRLGICRECPHKRIQPITSLELCGKCGCPVLSKTRFQRAACPIGKW